jgi:dipeptide/tripeptide permease
LTFFVKPDIRDIYYPLLCSLSIYIFIHTHHILHIILHHHRDATLPKYMLREFGENTPKGKVYAINPLLIIILVPIITAATSSVDPLIMIHIGTYVSALSVFFLAFSTSLWACIMFVITLSIGESLWSPRLYDYTTSIAPEGREGTYMALSSAPLFLAKLPVGLLSGVLLQKYCPETLNEEKGEIRHSKTMWLIIGLSTICSPILITLLWGYLSGGDRDIARRRSTDDKDTTTNIEMEYPDEKRMLRPADRPLPTVV